MADHHEPLEKVERPGFPTSPKAATPAVRGDRISGDRYWSTEFAQREWEHMWRKVWHIAGRSAQLQDAGDFIVHNFLHESVILIRQTDGSLRAFFNVCQHRGNRLLTVGEGGVDRSVTCAYHGWKWGIDGLLAAAQDEEDFAEGSPCGKLRLAELPCAQWGGFVFYSFDAEPVSLLDYLDPIPDLLATRDLENWVRVLRRTISVDTNWKFASDNFNESYHLPSVHPQQKAFIDEDYRTHVFEMYPSGHNRVVEMGRPSLRSHIPNEVEPAWGDMLREWDLDPADFAGRARDGRVSLQRAKRQLGSERGYTHYERMFDDELTDYFHHTLFPNLTVTAAPDGLHIFRTEPVIHSPERSTLDYWYLVPKIEGQASVPTIYGDRPLREAELETTTFRDHVAEFGQDDFLTQDLLVAETQQLGLRSAGYRDAYLSGQETRVRRFHEVLNDYLEGRRPVKQISKT